MAQLLKILLRHSGRREPPKMEDSVNLEDGKEENLVLIREGGENPFDRLSDDLIACHIFDKLPEAKCLFNCSLVCKRFPSLVYQVSTISLLLVPEKPSLANRFRRWKTNNLFGRKDDFKYLVELCDLKFLRQLMSNFLKNFKALKYVNIEFDSLRRLRMEPPLIIWRLDFQSDSLVVLLAKNPDSGATFSDDIIRSYLLVIDLSLLAVRYFSCSQTEPKSVVFNFAEKQGTVLLDEKGILCMKNPTRNYRRIRARTWYEPKLELASTGRIMENVKLLVFKGDDTVDDFLIAEKLSEGKDKIYSEAATEMLKKQVKQHTVGSIENFTFELSD